MRVSTGSRSFRTSSGSRSASSSIEPLRSVKRTVTCLRSPSRAAFDVRIFSTRCVGVYEFGAANLAVGAVRSGAALEKTLEPELYLPSSQAFQPLSRLLTKWTASQCSGFTRREVP